MFAKCTFVFALVALVALGQAHPAEHHHREQESSSEEHHHHGSNGGGSGGDKHNHHGKGHKHDHNQHEHGEGHYGGNMDVSIPPTSPFAKTKNLTEELYTEIFVIASGDNYASPEIPNDAHINARAAVLASQKLHAMTKVYPIFFNLTAEYALKGAKLEDKQTVIDLINDLVTRVASKCPNFETIKSGVSDSFIARGKHFKAGATQQEKLAAYDKWLYDPLVATASMNKLFYRAIFKEDKPHYRLLAAMVKEAESHHGELSKEKLEKIYANVTAKTVEKVCPSHEPRKAALIFYQFLMAELAEDAALLISLYGEDLVTVINKPF